MWLLKVTNLNRGRGIYVFNSIDQLISLINDCAEDLINCTIAKEQDNASKHINDKDKTGKLKLKCLVFTRRPNSLLF